MGLVSWVIQLVLNLSYLGSWACFAVGNVGQTWNFANRTKPVNTVDGIDDIIHNSNYYCNEGLWLRCCTHRDQECALIFTDKETLAPNQLVMDIPTLMQHGFAAGSMLLAGLLPILAVATLCCGNKLGAYVLQATSGLFALVSLVTYLTYYIGEKKITPIDSQKNETQSWDFHEYFPDSGSVSKKNISTTISVISKTCLSTRDRIWLVLLGRHNWNLPEHEHKLHSLLFLQQRSVKQNSRLIFIKT